jgi:hypothetical protein
MWRGIRPIITNNRVRRTYAPLAAIALALVAMAGALQTTIDGAEHKRLGQPHVDFGHTVKSLWMMLEIGLRTDDAAPDMLVILDGRGIEHLNMSRGLASMVESFTKQRKTILVADAARRSLTAIGLESATVLQAGNLAHVMKQIVERVRPAQGALAKTI